MGRFEFGIVELHEYAVVAGGADALFELGLMYSAGRDVAMDLIQAHKWFNLAMLRGNEYAKRCGMEASGDLIHAEAFTAQRLARNWLAKKLIRSIC